MVEGLLQEIHGYVSHPSAGERKIKTGKFIRSFDSPTLQAKPNKITVPVLISLKLFGPHNFQIDFEQVSQACLVSH